MKSNSGTIIRVRRSIIGRYFSLKNFVFRFCLISFILLWAFLHLTSSSWSSRSITVSSNPDAHDQTHDDDLIRDKFPTSISGSSIKHDSEISFSSNLYSDHIDTWKHGEIPPTILVPKEKVQEFRSLVNYSASTYCLSGLANWTCATCGSEGTIGTSNVTMFGDFAFHGFGYVAVNPIQKRIILAFRGTRNLDNWIKDLTFAQPNCPFPGAPDGTKLHLGFLKVWQSVKAEALDALMNHMSRFESPLEPGEHHSRRGSSPKLPPDWSFLICGHSLGGALAQISAVDLSTSFSSTFNKSQIHVFTLNQPRVGNQIWSDWYTELGFASSWRIVQQNDLTPHLPPIWSGFVHSPNEIWIHQKQENYNQADEYYYFDEVSNTLQQGTTHRVPQRYRQSNHYNEADIKDKNSFETFSCQETKLNVSENDACSNSHNQYAIKTHGYVWDIPVGILPCLGI